MPGGRAQRAVTALPGLLLALGLGLWGIRRGGTMWRDEAVTYDVSRRGFADLWHTLGNADAVHGLYYLLMHGLFRITGDADPLLVMRIPSVLAMSAAAAGVALLGRRLAGARAGLLSGVAFAAFPLIQRFAQEGRSYAAVCALTVWATSALVDAVAAEGPRARRLWCRYTALVLAACLLHEFAVFALAGHAFAVPRAARRQWAAAAGAAVVGLAPLAVLSRRQQAQVQWLSFDTRQYAATLGVCLVGVGCAALLRRWGSRRTGPVGLVRVALPLLTAPVCLLMALAPVKPLFVDRYVLYIWAGLALLAGGVLDRSLRGGPGRAAVASVTVLAALAALIPLALHLRTPESRVDNSTGAAHAVRAAGHAGDAVVYMPSRRRVWALSSPAAVEGLRDIALDRSPAASHTLYGREVPAGVIRDRMSGERRIVLVTDPAGSGFDAIDRETVKRRVIEDRFARCRSWHTRGARVILYARPGGC
ncbi:glycosyltransferase family 39 protein [Streptomyces sp. NPDC046465]|uniref:glycosyltransferase family 39 protein n=1 Tax=Streptomyces sp. NPDC046465 TaxID=3155810 RepID=UPI0033DB1702